MKYPLKNEISKKLLENLINKLYINKNQTKHIYVLLIIYFLKIFSWNEHAPNQLIFLVTDYTKVLFKILTLLDNKH